MWKRDRLTVDAADLLIGSTLGDFLEKVNILEMSLRKCDIEGEGIFCV